MELKMSFEIRKINSSERITSIEADSFKEAINEFSRSYDVASHENYLAISGENRLEFHFSEDRITAVFSSHRKT